MQAELPIPSELSTRRVQDHDKKDSQINNQSVKQSVKKSGRVYSVLKEKKHLSELKTLLMSDTICPTIDLNHRKIVDVLTLSLPKSMEELKRQIFDSQFFGIGYFAVGIISSYFLFFDCLRLKINTSSQLLTLSHLAIFCNLCVSLINFSLVFSEYKKIQENRQILKECDKLIIKIDNLFTKENCQKYMEVLENRRDKTKKLTQRNREINNVLYCLEIIEEDLFPGSKKIDPRPIGFF